MSATARRLRRRQLKRSLRQKFGVTFDPRHSTVTFPDAGSHRRSPREKFGVTFDSWQPPRGREPRRQRARGRNNDNDAAMLLSVYQQMNNRRRRLQTSMLQAESTRRAPQPDFVVGDPVRPTKSTGSLTKYADFVWSGPVGSVWWNLALTEHLYSALNNNNNNNKRICTAP